MTHGDAELRVAAVLGAGNVSSIGAMDVLHMLVFAERQACVLKLHPVNSYLGEIHSAAFAGLIEEGGCEWSLEEPRSAPRSSTTRT